VAATEDRLAGATILKDLGLFNKAVVYYTALVEPLIRTEVGKIVEAWLKQNKDWMGETDATNSLEFVWIAPLSWRRRAEQDQEGEPSASAWFALGPRSKSESYEVADLFDVGTIDYGFHFKVDRAAFGGAARWNAYARTLTELGQQLSAKKWTHTGQGSFFQPLKLPAHHLVEAWNNEDWGEALAPLSDALEALKNESLATFNSIVDGARKDVP
jgi:hypothetical protein